MLAIKSRVFLILFCFIESAASVVGTTPFEYKFSTVQNGQHINVFLQLRPFDAKSHKRETKGNEVLIDGKIPVGIGPGSLSAQTEFSRFEVRWNDKRVEVPASLYSDLFNPSLTPKTNPGFDQKGSVWTSVDTDGSRILLEVEGGNDAVAYKAWIIVSRTGKCLRFLSDTTP